MSIPDSVTTIGDSAFAGCYGLTSVSIPASVRNIGDSAFAYCSGLTSVSIPSSITRIGNEDFFNCYGLSKVTVPAGVTSIGDSAFAGCSLMTSVSIPASVTNIGDYAFADCSHLAAINCLGDAPTLGGMEVFSNDVAKVYYIPGAAGWYTNSRYGGLLTVPLTVRPASVQPLLAVSRTGPGLLMAFQAEAGGSYRLLVSSDLRGWVPLATNVAVTAGPLQFFDSLSEGWPQGFYRVVSP
jgi:hypothetical protein